ncbi:MAG: ABC transporter permease [Bacteroidota bacterium]
MIKRISILIRKDFFEFCFSKSWIIVLMMPLFIGFLYLVVYKQAGAERFTLGYTPMIDSSLLKIIKKSPIDLRLFPDQNTAESALNQGKVDGVIFENGQTNRFTFLTDKARTQEAVLIVNSINLALINASLDRKTPQVNLTFTDRSLPTRWLSFPVWLLQIILTVCLLQATAAIADEKEKQTLHSLMITPMSVLEYLFSKSIWYTIVGVGALFLTIGITRAPIDLRYVLLFGVVGSLTFGALSLLIGLLAPTAMFARALATVTYLTAALPLMVRNLSFKWKGNLNIFPSFLILKGFEKGLFLNSTQSEVALSIIGLLAQTSVFLLITNLYIQKKADF